jgi:hypothetical protein
MRKHILKYLVLICLVTPNVYADDWFCSQASSERRGFVFKECGRGQGYTQSEALLNATEDAKYHFQQACQLSKDCKYNVNFNSEFKRSECRREKRGRDKLGMFHWGGYVCVQLVVFVME